MSFIKWLQVFCFGLSVGIAGTLIWVVLLLSSSSTDEGIEESHQTIVTSFHPQYSK